MNIEYRINADLSPEQFVDLLKRSTLSERRPIDDKECIEGMLKNSNLSVTAWSSGMLVGIARSVTDFNYACYLSDLAVSKCHQRKGIGKQLLSITQKQLGPKCKLILVAAPAANTYYEKIGFQRNDRCWILEHSRHIE